MKRKMVAIVLILTLVALPTMAASKLNNSLIGNAKQALSLMSYGEYKKAIKKLSFAKNAPTAAELTDFVDTSLSDLYTVTVQTDVAVAYHLDSGWRIAVPIEEPSYDSVQTLVLRSKDGKSFDAYKAMSWYEVQNDIDNADNVIWQDAYDSGDYYLVADE